MVLVEIHFHVRGHVVFNIVVLLPNLAFSASSKRTVLMVRVWRLSQLRSEVSIPPLPPPRFIQLVQGVLADTKNSVLLAH